MDYNPNDTFCFKEWFPSKESIAVQYRILYPNKETHQLDIVDDKSNALYKNLEIEYYNSEKRLIGKVKNHNEIWTHVTSESDVLEFCV